MATTHHHDAAPGERSMRSTAGLRKGAWTAEEDILLRKCIEKYGEGKWHQVPVLAGLNRCRKSCRLRWLNYLKPDIKRGDFASDEIDLIIKLHKLLGNRWTLIAGRLPGRTANAVKNYWNTHLQKKIAARREPEEGKDRNINNTTKPMASNIVKPRAWNFSKNAWNFSKKASWSWGKTTRSAETTTVEANDAETTIKDSSSISQRTEKDNSLHWWDNLFLDIEDNDCEGTTWSLGGGLGEDHITSLWAGDLLQLGFEDDNCTHDGSGFASVDADLWGFSNF